MAAIRAFSIWLSGRKLATFKGGSNGVKNAGEKAIGDGGVVLGFSSGSVSNDISLDVTVLIEGTVGTQRLREAVVSALPVEVQTGIIDGKVQKNTMWCTEITDECSHENGTLTAKVTLTGGAPTLT